MNIWTAYLLNSRSFCTHFSSDKLHMEVFLWYLKLSDAFLEKTDSPMLELIVRIININLPVNHPILERCRPLYEYSWFIQQIKDCQEKGMNRDDAIIAAMADCREAGILTDFLREHGTEAVNMLFTEFNVEDALEVRGEEKFEEGRLAGLAEGKMAGLTEGKAAGILELLEELGQVSDELKKPYAARARRIF